MATTLQPEVVAAPRHLLGVDDLSADDFDALLDLAAVMRRHPLAWRGALEGRAVACLFEKPSTRSRVSLEVAVNRLGALPVVLQPEELRLAEGDSLADTAEALSSYCDAIAVRTGRHRDLLELAEHASVPLINALTDREHPCRALADCLMLRDRFGALRGLEIACVGAAGPLTHSLIEAAALAHFTVRVAAPDVLLPDPALLARAGRSVQVCETPEEAVSGAVAVYAATPDLAPLAAPGAMFMRERRAIREREANLLPVEQAMLRALVTGDWEV